MASKVLVAVGNHRPGVSLAAITQALEDALDRSGLRGPAGSSYPAGQISVWQRPTR